MRSNGRGRPCKYPWKEWFVKGKVIELQQGRDFDGYTRSFVGTIYRAATKYGVRVRVSQLSNSKLLVTRI